jgi:hypothetical protein
MAVLRVEIQRYVADEPQPGIVDCAFRDAFGVVHRFRDKTAIVSRENLNCTSGYPRPGALRCLVAREWADEEGRRLVCIDTFIDGVASDQGATQFVVLETQIQR